MVYGCNGPSTLTQRGYPTRFETLCRLVRQACLNRSKQSRSELEHDEPLGLAGLPLTADPPVPSPWMIPHRSSPSRVRFAASRPGLLRADPRGWLFMRGKGGAGRGAPRAGCQTYSTIRYVIVPIVGAERRKEPFGHTSRLEPQRRGAVTRRAVAQRRSRAGRLDSPLGAGYPGVLDWVLLPFRFPRSAAVFPSLLAERPFR